jgi:hypothetical protein
VVQQRRFPSPVKLCGYAGPYPRVKQSGASDRRGPLSKHSPKYLRWALFEAAMNACAGIVGLVPVAEGQAVGCSSPLARPSQAQRIAAT